MEFPLVDGQGDPALSELGHSQAELVCARLAGSGVDVVYVTTLQRTLQTAAPLLERLEVDAMVERDLREVFLGSWEGGLFRQKVLEGDPVALQMAEEQRYDVIPGAEPADAFSNRVRRGVGRIATTHAGARVAVFTHGGVICEILAQATGSQPFAFSGTDNASISHVVVTGERWVLRRFNDTTHLDDAYTLRPAPLT